MKKLFVLSLLTLALTLAAAGREAGLNAVAAAGDPKALFDAKCSKCHGTDGKGIKSLSPPDFTDAKWQASRKDAQLIATINNGKDTMPGFKGAIPAADIKALVKLVRDFAPKPMLPAKKK